MAPTTMACPLLTPASTAPPPSRFQTSLSTPPACSATLLHAPLLPPLPVPMLDPDHLPHPPPS